MSWCHIVHIPPNNWHCVGRYPRHHAEGGLKLGWSLIHSCKSASCDLFLLGLPLLILQTLVGIISPLVTPETFQLTQILLPWIWTFLLSLTVSFLASLLCPPNEGHFFYFLLFHWTRVQPDLFLHKVIPKLCKIWQLLMSTDTLNKRPPRRNKSIQGNGHRLFIFHHYPYGMELISRLCDPVQIAHHYICPADADGWKLVLQEHLSRDTRTLI